MTRGSEEATRLGFRKASGQNHCWALHNQEKRINLVGLAERLVHPRISAIGGRHPQAAKVERSFQQAMVTEGVALKLGARVPPKLFEHSGVRPMTLDKFRHLNWDLDQRHA